MEKAKIIEMTRTGHSPNEIAEELNIAVETLEAFSRIHEINLNPKVKQKLNARATVTEKLGMTKEKNVQIKITFEQVKECHEKGMKIHEIAEEYGVALATVRKHLKELGAVRQYEAKKLKKFVPDTVFKQKYGTFKPDPEEVRRLYVDEGMSRDMLAFHYEVCRGSIDFYLEKHQIKLTPEQKRLRKGSFKDKQEFIDAIEKYRTAKAVAEHFGFGVPTAYYHANEFGVKFKSERTEMTERLTDLAFEYMASDMKLKPFAAMHEVKYQSLYNVIKRLGIDVRSKKFVEDLVTQ